MEASPVDLVIEVTPGVRHCRWHTSIRRLARYRTTYPCKADFDPTAEILTDDEYRRALDQLREEAEPRRGRRAARYAEGAAGGPAAPGIRGSAS